MINKSYLVGMMAEQKRPDVDVMGRALQIAPMRVRWLMAVIRLGHIYQGAKSKLAHVIHVVKTASDVQERKITRVRRGVVDACTSRVGAAIIVIGAQAVAYAFVVMWIWAQRG